MLSKTIEEALNEQVALEAFSSNQYLAMASWMDQQGFEGTATFLYEQSDEERMHMMKLFHYINDAGGFAITPALESPVLEFDNYKSTFELILQQEQKVSNAIHGLVNKSLEAKDYTTHNFLQWYVSEQLEEEAMFRTILDKLKIIGDNSAALYMLDRDLKSMAGEDAELDSQMGE
jgi:ferritin